MSKSKGQKNETNGNEVEQDVPEVTTATETATPPAPPAEPTSEVLDKLKAERLSTKTKQRNYEIDSKEERELGIKVFELEQKMKIEVANIRKQENEQAEQEKKNARIKIYTDARDAERESIHANYNADLSDEEKQRLYDVAKELGIACVNALLSSKGTSHVASSTGTRKSSGKVSLKDQIRELIIPMYAEDKTRTDVRAFIIGEQGFNDGTANQAILEYEKEIGIKE